MASSLVDDTADDVIADIVNRKRWAEKKKGCYNGLTTHNTYMLL